MFDGDELGLGLGSSSSIDVNGGDNAIFYVHHGTSKIGASFKVWETIDYTLFILLYIVFYN